eukprot:557826-Pyramimonas_sp.AAC.1
MFSHPRAKVTARAMDLLARSGAEVVAIVAAGAVTLVRPAPKVSGRDYVDDGVVDRLQEWVATDRSAYITRRCSDKGHGWHHQVHA